MICKCNYIVTQSTLFIHNGNFLNMIIFVCGLHLTQEGHHSGLLSTSLTPPYSSKLMYMGTTQNSQLARRHVFRLLEKPMQTRGETCKRTTSTWTAPPQTQTSHCEVAALFIMPLSPSLNIYNYCKQSTKTLKRIYAISFF